MKKQPVFFKRKRFVTQLSLQTRCTAWVAVVLLAFGSLVGANLRFSGASLTAAFWMVLAVQSAIFLALAILATLWFSNRVAGPLFRLREVLDRIAQGDFTARLYLRQGDELADLAGSINAMVQSLQDHAQRDVNLALRISEKLKGLSSKVQQEQLAPEQVAFALGEILPEMRHVASCYKMKGH